MREWLSVRSIWCVAVALGALALAGCGGSGGNSGAGGSLTDATPSLTNKGASFSLSGSPPKSVSVGQSYSFTPTVASSGGTVSFSIQNAPPWATFNASIGALTGTPPAADAGTDSNIIITATDGTASATLGPFSIEVAEADSGAGTAEVSWTPPTTNTNGSTLTDLAGYVIYYGTNPNALTQQVQVTNVGLTSYVISGLTSGTWYFGVTAYTSTGAASTMSNVASKTIA
jgi:hypothetical protein